MKQLMLLAFLSASVFLCSTPVFAEAGVVIANAGTEKLSDGPGYQYFKIDGAKHAQTVQAKTGETVPVEDKFVYVFSTLEGVQNSDLPEVIKQDIYADYDIPAGVDLSTISTGPLIVDQDAAEEMAAELQSRYSDGGKNPDEQIQKFGLDCGGRWDSKSVSDQRSLSAESFSRSVNGDNGFEGLMEGQFDLNGTINYTLKYSERENPCFFSIPYRARWDRLIANGNVSVGNSTLSLSGTLFEVHRNVFETRLLNAGGDVGVWVGYVYLIFDFDLDVHTGLDVYAKASGTMNYSATGSGQLVFDISCDDDGCEELTPTSNTIQFTSAPSNLTYSITAEASVMPYLTVTPAMAVALYHKSLVAADVELPIKIGVPVSYWYHHNSGACGDADDDGVAETVTGEAVYAEMQLQAAFKWDMLFWNDYQPLNIPLPSANWRNYLGPMSGERPAIRKLLSFDDRQGSSNSVISPMIYASSNISQEQGGINIAQRNCYPWHEDVRYRVSWGDGSAGTIVGATGGFPAFHQWPAKGHYTITVKSLDDVYGRDFDNPFTRRTVFVSGSGDVFLPPNPPASINVPPSGNKYGKIDVSWGSASGDVSYYKLWRLSGGSRVPVYEGSNRSYRDTVTKDGTYFYEVAACSESACSVPVKSSNGAKVLIAPTRPSSIGPETSGSTDGSYEIYWSASSGKLTHYQLQVSTTNDFSSGRAVVYQGTNTSYFASHMAEDYYWYRVRACNQTACSSWRGTAAVKVFRPDTNYPRR